MFRDSEQHQPQLECSEIRGVILKKKKIAFGIVVELEPEPQGAGTFGWSRNIEVSAPAPGSSQLK
jgi:hypothetical protein